MPTQAEQKTAALAVLTLHIDPTVTQPTLTNQQVSDLLDQCLRASVWEANKAYSVGDVVVPVNRNGYRYRAIQRGTSGGGEPVWGETTGSTTADGTSSPQLTWQEDGPDFDNVYNVRRALHRACMMKAGRVAEVFASGGQQMQQVHEHWLRLADKYGEVQIA